MESNFALPAKEHLMLDAMHLKGSCETSKPFKFQNELALRHDSQHVHPLILQRFNYYCTCAGQYSAKICEMLRTFTEL